MNFKVGDWVLIKGFVRPRRITNTGVVINTTEKCFQVTLSDRWFKPEYLTPWNGVTAMIKLLGD